MHASHPIHPDFFLLFAERLLTNEIAEFVRVRVLFLVICRSLSSHVQCSRVRH